MTAPCPSPIDKILVYDSDTDFTREPREYVFTCSIDGVENGEEVIFRCEGKRRDETRESYRQRYSETVEKFLEFIEQHPELKTVGKDRLRIVPGFSNSDSTIDTRMARTRAQNCNLHHKFWHTLARLDRDANYDAFAK